ncbi:type III-B CRISPR module-associated protein Cmr5 [Dethiobacter alkaliphilus]|uniref:type III-B CRISPR module-associated protein Cmr5 n=1 Tax=Dethiobacter alkaliphilus TaxID=427926 RepID=UPI002226E2A3|nr:type III-B CRISPR module-associated protein Cmr5 [Dethiobacter alkaliphilus]MCW3488683.1 type III-B CRISPR module-associated protein Cmr5 [Dethiobacter alkaliphilus]
MEKTKLIQSLEQGRALFAYQKAEEAKEQGAEMAKKYKSYVKKVPMLVKNNGLGAAFAFVKAKGTARNEDGGLSSEKAAYKKIYDDTAEWLRQSPLEFLAKEKELLEHILSLPSDEYRALTNEVMAFFFWLGRCAEGLIEGEAEND